MCAFRLLMHTLYPLYSICLTFEIMYIMLTTRQQKLDKENNILSAIMFIALALFIVTLGLRNDSCLQESFTSGKSDIKNVKIVNAAGKQCANRVAAESANSVILPGDISHFCQKRVLHLFASTHIYNNLNVKSSQYTSESKVSCCSCRYVVSKTSVVLLI